MTHPTSNAILILKGQMAAQQNGNSDVLDIINSHTFDRLPLQHKVDFLKAYARSPNSDVPEGSFSERYAPVATAGLGGAAMGGLVGSMLAQHNPYKNHYLHEMHLALDKNLEKAHEAAVAAGDVNETAHMLRQRDLLRIRPLVEEDVLTMHSTLSPNFNTRLSRFRAKTPEEKLARGPKPLVVQTFPLTDAELAASGVQNIKSRSLIEAHFAHNGINVPVDTAVNAQYMRHIAPDQFRAPVKQYMSKLRGPIKAFAATMGAAGAGAAYLNLHSEDKARHAANAALQRIRTSKDPDAEAMGLMFRKEELQQQRADSHHVGLNHMDAALKYGPMALPLMR